MRATLLQVFATFLVGTDAYFQISIRSAEGNSEKSPIEGYRLGMTLNPDTKEDPKGWRNFAIYKDGEISNPAFNEDHFWAMTWSKLQQPGASLGPCESFPCKNFKPGETAYKTKDWTLYNMGPIGPKSPGSDALEKLDPQSIDYLSEMPFLGFPSDNDSQNGYMGKMRLVRYRLYKPQDYTKSWWNQKQEKRLSFVTFDDMNGDKNEAQESFSVAYTVPKEFIEPKGATPFRYISGKQEIFWVCWDPVKLHLRPNQQKMTDLSTVSKINAVLFTEAQNEDGYNGRLKEAYQACEKVHLDIVPIYPNKPYGSYEELLTEDEAQQKAQLEQLEQDKISISEE